MTDQHRASPADWLLHAASLDDADSSCILELRARTEALEAAQLEQAESHRFCVDAIVRRIEALEAAQKIRSGPESPFVERVADAIAAEATSAGIINDRPARAAIREVAAAAKDLRFTTAKALIDWLDREADRG
jgi:hypothetical protein